MADAEAMQTRSGWGGHIWVAVVAAFMGTLSPYFFGAALAIQYSIGGASGEPASTYVALAIALTDGLRMALAPIFWLGIVLWFVGSTLQLRRGRLRWLVWPAWGAVTLGVSYVIGVLVLFPKSEIGRHMVLVRDPFSLDAAIGVAGSSAIGAVVGMFLFALSPKWPGSPLTSSGSN